MVFSRIKNRVKGSGLARQTLAYGLTSAVAAGIPVVVGPILTHFLEPRDYGIAALFLAAFNMLAPIAGVGAQTAFRRRYYQKEEYDYPSYVWSTSLGVVANATLLTLLATVTYSAWGSEDVSQAWTFSFLPWMLGRYLIGTASALLQLERRPLAFGVITWINSLLGVAATLSFVVLLNFKWEGRVLGQVVGGMLLGVGCIPLIRQLLGPGAKFEIRWVKDAFRFGAPGVPYAVLDRVLQFGDRALIAALAGIDAAGYYTLGIQISGLTTRAATAFNQAWQPWLFERLKEDTRSSKRRAAIAFYIASAGLLASSTALWLAVRWLFPLIIGDKYEPAIALVPWMCWALALRGVSSLQSSLIIYSEQMRYLTKIAVTTGTLNLAISALFIWFGGVAGAAYAMFTTSFLRLAAVWWVARRLVPLPGL